jgi:hypothetical protein
MPLSLPNSTASCHTRIATRHIAVYSKPPRGHHRLSERVRTQLHQDPWLTA